MKRIVSRSFVVSVAAVTAAAALCVVAAARALTISPPDAAETPPAGVVSRAELSAGEARAARVPSEGVLTAESLELAIDNDPFTPDRRRAAPYALPGERTPRSAPARAVEPVDLPPFRVIGTAVIGESGMALVEPLEPGPTEIIRVGASLHGYRLEGVDAESATLVRLSETFTLGVQPGSDLRRRSEALWSAVGRGADESGMQYSVSIVDGRPVIRGLNLGFDQVDMIELPFGQGWQGLPPTFEIRPFDGAPVRPAFRRVAPDTSRIELPDTREQSN